MVSVSQSALAGIVQRPETFVSAYDGLGVGASSAVYMQSQLGSAFASLSNAGCMATFASIVAYNVAPSGNTSLAALTATLHELLASPTLTSDHFCKLAMLLTLLGSPQLIPPDDAQNPTVHFTAWLPSVPLNTGYHSQLIITNVLDDAYLLLDPMYAYAVRVPYVGSGPQANLTDIENAATMMRTPIPPENLAVLDPAGTAASPGMLQTIISGAMGPEYLYTDATYGPEAWDASVSQTFANMG